MGSARFGVVGAADAAGDEAYFAQILAVDTDELLDYTNEVFSSSVAEADAKIPLEQDTRANRTNYYRTPVLDFLGEAGWIELSMHNAEGRIVAAPIRYFIRDGAIADPPVSITGDSFWESLGDISIPQVATVPDNMADGLALVVRYHCRKKVLNTGSGALQLYNDAGTNPLLTAPVTTAGGVQTVGALVTP